MAWERAKPAPTLSEGAQIAPARACFFFFWFESGAHACFFSTFLTPSFAPPVHLQKKEKGSSVGPVVLGFFLFVVVGSGERG